MNYTIVRVSSSVREVKLDHGDFLSYRFYCEGHGETVFSLLQKPETAPPQAGDNFEATVKSTFDDGTVNLKKVQQQGASRGGGSRDLSPEAQARIDAIGRVKGRCHAQAVAAALLDASGELASIDFYDSAKANDFLLGVFKPLVDFLVADADTAREAKA